MDIKEVISGTDAGLLTAELAVLIALLLLSARFPNAPSIEFLIVGLMVFVGARLALVLWAPEAGTAGELLLGLIALVGAPLAWVEFRSKGRESRMMAFKDAHLDFITNKELATVAIFIECFSDDARNPVRDLLERGPRGSTNPQNIKEVHVNRRLDTYLTYLNDMCAMSRRGWIGKAEFEEGLWAYYAEAACDPEKDSLHAYVTNEDWGWTALNDVALRRRQEKERRKRRKSEIASRRNLPAKAAVWLRYRLADALSGVHLTSAADRLMGR